ncbi:MAG TPA: hypothetical protein VFG69_13260, partial [Nannocystaceae bacterium]|nr:hypothetical protein [Nannocystaceae bacterium]
PSTSLPRVPEGVLWRVPPPAEVQLPLELVAQRHRDALARLVGPPTTAHSPFAGDLAARWGEPTAALLLALRRAGRDDLATPIEDEVASRVPP